MPGLVKQHPPLPVRAQSGMKKLLARMAYPEDSLPSFKNENGPIRLSKEAIIWISIVGVLVVTTAIIVTVLLCRCTWTRKKKEKKYHANGHSHHASLEVTDGRNDHLAWNRSFAPQGPRTYGGADADGFRLTPLARAAERPGREHLEGLPPRPVVVDDDEIDPLAPVPPARAAKGNLIYYSGFSGALKRVSQIGKAY